MVFAGRIRHVLVLLCAILLGYFYHSRRLAAADSRLWTALVSGDPASSWKDVRLKYPPKRFTPLPIPRAKSHDLPRVQFEFGPETEAERHVRLSRRDAVKKAFVRSWKSYKRLAWKADELMPVTGKPKNNYAGWGATLVDNLDTLWIMDLKEDFEFAVTAAVDIHFNSSALQEINVFETTIRYLGGFLSAYDLSRDSRLLSKASQLGDMLLIAFDTPNNLPITRWTISKAPQGQEAEYNVLLAEIGSLSLEFTRLSQLTGDNRYYSATEAITTLLASQQTQTLLPGLWPLLVDARDANFTRHDTFTLGGMADSAYEYLPKMHALLAGADPRFATMYRLFSNAAHTHLIRRPNIPSPIAALIPVDLTISSTGHPHLNEQSQHLSCFLGGLFALGGALFSLPAHVALGAQLANFCLWAYAATPTGLMPELFTVTTCAAPAPCAWNATLWRAGIAAKTGLRGPDDPWLDRHVAAKALPRGFTSIVDRSYALRPEALESCFVLHRVTGEKKWADAAWGLFEAVVAQAETGLAYGKVRDVTRADGGGERGDEMESFWMAETLKYAYLVFSEPELVSLDRYVFNTEAHPFLRPGAAE